MRGSTKDGRPQAESTHLGGLGHDNERVREPMRFLFVVQLLLAVGVGGFENERFG